MQQIIYNSQASSSLELWKEFEPKIRLSLAYPGAKNATLEVDAIS